MQFVNILHHPLAPLLLSLHIPLAVNPVLLVSKFDYRIMISVHSFVITMNYYY